MLGGVYDLSVWKIKGITCGDIPVAVTEKGHLDKVQIYSNTSKSQDNLPGAFPPKQDR